MSPVPADDEPAAESTDRAASPVCAIESLGRDTAATRAGVSTLGQKYAKLNTRMWHMAHDIAGIRRDMADSADELARLADCCDDLGLRARRVDTDLFELRAAAARQTDLIRSLLNGSDRPTMPDGRAQREFATQLALWVICDDEDLEEDARGLDSPDKLRTWAARTLSGTIASTHLEDVDYGRLYALLR